jgi:hypothetical protein
LGPSGRRIHFTDSQWRVFYEQAKHHHRRRRYTCRSTLVQNAAIATKKSPLRRDGSFRRVLWRFLKQLGFAKGFLARDPDGHAVHLIERYFTQQHTPPVGGIKNPQPLATE